MRRGVIFLSLLAAVSCFAPRTPAETVLEWMWSGAVTARSAVVKFSNAHKS